MKILKDFLSSVLAGVMISFGGTVFLCAESKVVGALFFSLGLCVILMQGFLLFTGKSAYVFQNKPTYLLWLLLIWIGNLCGCALMGLIVKAARFPIAQKATEICSAKLEQTPIATMLLGALCGILVYIAVDYYKNPSDTYPFSKYLLVFTCVPAFILCGFEHSVADMFYFAASSDMLLYSSKGILYILYVTVGNLVGAIVFHNIKKFVIAKKADS